MLSKLFLEKALGGEEAVGRKVVCFLNLCVDK